MARKAAKKTRKPAKRKASRKPSKAMAAGTVPGFNEADLNKGHQRKLAALRKSLGGPKIADPAFAKWLKAKAKAAKAHPKDKNAEVIAEALGKLVLDGKLRIRRGGYLISRGRGRVIVTDG